jgi:hypothetical protein
MDLHDGYKRLHELQSNFLAMSKRAGDQALINECEQYTHQVNAIWYELLRQREAYLNTAIANSAAIAKLLSDQHDQIHPPI